ncbi:MAG: hypothetical protein COT74_02980 [Bdellovibrionales bacterium CG10_big_fil_rev_8_21_14_0_10_45_34]|nr:MAG: hypothetical protein COT74_02980 [Bdellovibrionales bacterium CG10_big_fil_rev_8_21_14_0_10_45_34]
MTTPAPFYRLALRRELERRCEQNPRYSIRAFARSIGVNDGALSQIISGKRVPSDRTSKKLMMALELDPVNAQRFWLSLHDVQNSKRNSKPKSFTAGSKAESRDGISVGPGGSALLSGSRSHAKKTQENVQTTISLEEFQVIADWYHIALMEMCQNPRFEPTAKYISKRLKISEAQSTAAMQRLVELGYIEPVKAGYKKKRKDMTTDDKATTTSAHRIHQKQMLTKAIDALDEVPIECRSQIGMTMNIDPRLIPKAKQMIQKFSEELCTFLEGGRSRQVYQLSLSLFPLETIQD